MNARRLTAALFAFLATGPAWAGTDGLAGHDRQAAATPRSTPATSKPASPAALQGAPMKVVLVRSAEPGCEPNCPEWIAAQGMIDDGALPQFRKVLKSIGNRKLPILVDSGGGVVDESLEIGRLIRARGLDVAVAKTAFKPCAETDAACRKAAKAGGPLTGAPLARLSKCASSCAFILAAGIRRYVGPSTYVGVHQVTTFQTTAQILQKYRIEKKLVWGVPVETRRTLVSEKRVNEKTVVTRTPESTYTKVARYFSEMGIGGQLMPILKTTPSTSIHWLTRSELTATAMATDAVDGEQLITGVTTVPASGPAVRPLPAGASAIGASSLPPPVALPAAKPTPALQAR